MKIKIKRTVSVFFAAALLLIASAILPACKNRVEYLDEWDAVPDTLARITGADALGRVTEPKARLGDKYSTGMFYFLWNGSHHPGIYDVSELLENDPDSLWGTGNTVSPDWAMHYWGEPLFGYYNNLDPWVISRHVEMLTVAGIDFLIMDTTNGPTYDAELNLLLETLDKYRLQGFNVPQIAVMTNTDSIKTMKHFYDTVYADSKFKELWFSPNGKPLILGTKYGWATEDADIKNFFDIRETQWPKDNIDPRKFPWIDFSYPQTNHNGVLSVSVAQHNSVRMSNEDKGNCGRGYDFSEFKNYSAKSDEGLNYSFQWDTVFGRLDSVSTVFITGWNEWGGQKHVEKSTNKVYFVDTFNKEYSRDIEPMKGGHGDNFYMQTLQNIHKLKGETSGKVFREIGKGDWHKDAFWDNAVYEYRDFSGDAMIRNYDNSARTAVYTDNTARNDIVKVMAAHDAKYLYFKIETADEITAYESGAANWMNVMLNTGKTDSFGGFDYILNCAPDTANGKTSVMRLKNGFVTEDAGSADIGLSGKVMYLRVQRSLIGLSAEHPVFSFKVCDNIQRQNDFNDYYVSGDSAPAGRLAYAYGK